MELLTFDAGGTRYAIPSGRVLEVVPRVWVTPLAGAPVGVLGVVNYRGAPLCVVELRSRLGHPPRERDSLDEHLVIARGKTRTLGLLVDRVQDLLSVDDGEVRAPEAPTRHIAGVIAKGPGVVLLQELDALLTEPEEGALDVALRGHQTASSEGAAP